MKKGILLLTGIMLAIVLHASAQTQTPAIDQRQQNQRERIGQGVVSGELTRGEAVRSVHDQRRIRRTERRAKADGVVTAREKANLHRQQNASSRQLLRNKHDAQDRPGAN